MQDVRNGELPPDSVSMDDVINTYRHKTGRYTFSLPISLGALLRGSNIDTRHKLERMGEYLGVIFQIKDDEIGLFGDPDLTGKPNSSDLAEGKKTVFTQGLWKTMEESQKTELEANTQGLPWYEGSAMGTRTSRIVFTSKTCCRVSSGV